MNRYCKDCKYMLGDDFCEKCFEKYISQTTGELCLKAKREYSGRILVGYVRDNYCHGDWFERITWLERFKRFFDLSRQNYPF